MIRKKHNIQNNDSAISIIITELTIMHKAASKHLTQGCNNIPIICIYFNNIKT